MLHQCPHCAKTFPRRFRLEEHKQVHDGTRPFACPHCSRRFTRRHDCLNHERLHTGMRPFICTDHTRDGRVYGCGRTFSRESTLRRHQKSSGCVLLRWNNDKAQNTMTARDLSQGVVQDQGSLGTKDHVINLENRIMALTAALTSNPDAVSLDRTDGTTSDESSADQSEHGHEGGDEITTSTPSLGSLPKKPNDESYLPEGSQNWSNARRSLYSNFFRIHARNTFFPFTCLPMLDLLKNKTIEDDLRFMLLFENFVTRERRQAKPQAESEDLYTKFTLKLAPMELGRLREHRLIDQLRYFLANIEHVLVGNDNPYAPQILPYLFGLVEEHEAMWLGREHHKVCTHHLRHDNPRPDLSGEQDATVASDEVEEVNDRTTASLQAKIRKLERENQRLESLVASMADLIK